MLCKRLCALELSLLMLGHTPPEKHNTAKVCSRATIKGEGQGAPPFGRSPENKPFHKIQVTGRAGGAPVEQTVPAGCAVGRRATVTVTRTAAHQRRAASQVRPGKSETTLNFQGSRLNPRHADHKRPNHGHSARPDTKAHGYEEHRLACPASLGRTT